MDRMEMVEKLREKTGLSYEEARLALEKADWDLLDALIALEKDGKVGSAGSYTTRNDHNEGQPRHSEKPEGESFSQMMDRFWKWLKKVFRMSWENQLCMDTKGGKETLAIPVIIFAVLLLFAFWVVIPLMIVSLFFGCRYAFRGPDLGKESVNHVMGKATDVADSIKTEIRDSVGKN